ncbi:hypothetical protein OHT93_10945 [Streptomyces sp. NBC_00191]|uniref:hypothetical protein n=1 Tax=Streptomyces sp. NBC_00191 TaxID=2975674 RepID=UPI00324B75D3
MAQPALLLGVIDIKEATSTSDFVLSLAEATTHEGAQHALKDYLVTERQLENLDGSARRGGRGLWLLVPQSDPSREPRLGQVAVPYQAGLGEWIQLPDTWVGNAHRGSGEVVASASGVEGDVK